MQTNPKYMIDFPTYRQMHPQKFPQPLATDAEMEEQGVDMNKDNPPSDSNFILLLPASMPGYAFHDKKWSKYFHQDLVAKRQVDRNSGSLSMEHVGPVPWNDRAFDRLVLKETKKETIKALVTVHLKTVQNMDVVENKGNGLIILLHGSPGTGTVVKL